MYQTHREALYSSTDIHSHIPSSSSSYYTTPQPSSSSSSISNPTTHYYSLPIPIPNDPPYSSLPLQSQPQPHPYSNPTYPLLEDPPAYYHHDPAPSSWVVKQAAPVTYSSPVQPRIQEPDPPSEYDSFYRNWAIQNTNNLTTIAYNTPSKRPKPITKPKPASQKVKCKLCKIECTSLDLYEKHLSGKKHANTLQRLYGPQTAAAQTGQTSTGSSGNKKVDLAAKKRKLLEGGATARSLRMCTICNVACNGEIAFADHMAGKKHLAQERALANAANPKPAVAANPNPKPAEKATKKANTASAWCSVCKITCTSNEGLEVHNQGKKHKKNLEKLQNPKVEPTTTQPIKPKEPEDMETKKRKVLESGTSEDAVRTCTICNVVCNSETVFNTHLSGQRHAAMVKQKKDEEAGTGTGEAARDPQNETPTTGS